MGHGFQVHLDSDEYASDSSGNYSENDEVNLLDDFWKRGEYEKELPAWRYCNQPPLLTHHGAAGYNNFGAPNLGAIQSDTADKTDSNKG